MPRFVFLRHEVPAGYARPSHFDLMFEVDDSLLTWAVDTLPVIGGPPIPATPLPPHRIAYLDYEGPVSRNRGAVHRVARGTCELRSAGPSAAESRVEFALDSPSVCGRIIFEAGSVRIEAAEARSEG